jgi:hypothetical protein
LDVKQVTVVVSSPGNVFKDTLKELASKSERSPAQTVRVGQKLPDAAIFGSKQISAQYQMEIKEAPGFSAEGTTSDVLSSNNLSDVEVTLSDAERGNTQTINLDCTEEELLYKPQGKTMLIHHLMKKNSTLQLKKNVTECDGKYESSAIESKWRMSHFNTQ